MRASPSIRPVDPRLSLVEQSSSLREILASSCNPLLQLLDRQVFRWWGTGRGRRGEAEECRKSIAHATVVKAGAQREALSASAEGWSIRARIGCVGSSRKLMGGSNRGRIGVII